MIICNVSLKAAVTNVKIALPGMAITLGLGLFTGSAMAQSIGGSGVEASVPKLDAREMLQKPEPSELLHTSAEQPFGASLFQGGFSNDSEDGLNPRYVVQSGDRVSVRIWGATQFNEQLVVDHQGNIFIPSVGPILVAGSSNKTLNARVTKAVGRVFTDSVKVYTNLDGSQPVAVFVTGFVNNPGRFAGIPSNSPLYFLDRAGGVDADRGSYRQIRIVRGGDELLNMDLYEFILQGKLPSIQFQDGDTIVVDPRGSVVEATGNVANSARFEFKTHAFEGADLMAVSHLDVDVNYVGVSGFRNSMPFSSYMTIDDFKSLTLANGDSVNFQADQHDQQIIVTVEGSHLGPSRYSVPTGTRLNELLDYVEVDPLMANIAAISLKRKAIAARQKEALEEGLRRLEASYLTASSQTDKESLIRVKEAELIGRFVERARRVQPNGRLVVAGKGSIANVVLKQGDTVSIPSQSDSILIGGEVLVSQAMLFNEGQKAREYIKRSGGFTRQAMKKNIVLLHANGEVSTGENPRVRQGDEIIVLPQVPVKNLQISSTIVDILYKVAVAASVAIQL